MKNGGSNELLIKQLKDRKIPIQNIFYMLSYILNTTIPSVVSNIAPEDFDNIYEFYASILIRVIDHVIKQGLYREYVNICEDIPTVRGKINMPGTIKNIFARRRLITCEYDELSENILLNQIIKTTIFSLCHCKEIDSKLRKDLNKNLWRFLNIDIIDNPSLIPWSKLVRHQNNRQYQALIDLCRYILEKLLRITDTGLPKRLTTIDADAPAYDFYEEFIREYFHKNYGELFVEDRWFDWSLNGTRDKVRDKYLPKMQFDVMLTDGYKSLIIDAKYSKKIIKMRKKQGTSRLSSNNLYQIFTYVRNWQLELADPKSKHFKGNNTKFNYNNGNHVVNGMLLYAKAGGQADLNSAYEMRGNYYIYARTLDLSRESYTEIGSQLDNVVKDIFPNFFKDHHSNYPIEPVL